jgi:hypothetical protein
LLEDDVWSGVIVADLIASNQASFRMAAIHLRLIVFYCETVCAGIEVDAESTVVGGVGGWEGL